MNFRSQNIVSVNKKISIFLYLLLNMLISVKERKREQKIYDIIKLPKCSSGQKIHGCGFHHLLTLSVPLSLSVFDILSPWTLFPSQFIPLSSPFLSFHPFLFLSLSVSCISPSLSFRTHRPYQADYYIHLSLTTVGTAMQRVAVVLSSWLPVTFVLVFCFCFEVFKASFRGRGECQRDSMSRWITSALK